MAKAKVKKPFNKQAKIVAALRKVWRYSPERYEAINLARDPSTPKHIICSVCKKSTHEKLAAVDHIEPIVDARGFINWDLYVEKLFCATTNLQLICEICHKIKSKEETQARAAYKKIFKTCKNPT